MEKLIKDPSPKLRQMTFEDLITSIFSPALAGGHSPCVSPDGPTIDLSEQDHVPANHSPSPAVKRAKRTIAISGQSCSSSSSLQGSQHGSESKSPVVKLSELSLSLLSLPRFNRERTNLPISSQSELLSERMSKALRLRISGGSMEYRQTWNRRITPCGRECWEHTASARRKSDNVSGGWPTPAVQNADGGVNPRGNVGEHFTLQTAADLAGWVTPNTVDAQGGVRNGIGQTQLCHQTQMAGWGTPTAHERTFEPRQVDHGVQLANDVQMAGWPTPQVAQGPNMSENRGENHGGSRQRKTPQSVEGLVAGWPTPDSSHHGNIGPEKALARMTSHTNGGPKYSTNLDDAVQMAGWGTPRTNDGTTSQASEIPPSGTKHRLELEVLTAGWATPAARDYKSESATDDFNQKRELQTRGKPLSYEALGATTDLSNVSTERRGVLDAMFSLWLMGFPETFSTCSPGWKEWEWTQGLLKRWRDSQDKTAAED